MARPRSVLALPAALVLAFAAAGCGGGDGGDDRSARGGDPRTTTVWAVGDGAVPAPEPDQLGDLLEKQDLDRFLYLGDVYETGTFEEFARNYQPAFGRFKRVTEPIPGDHEWANRETGYNAYWAAHRKREGGRYYYSFDLGGWHFVALNSEEPIGRRSRQLAWLRDDLEGREDNCTVVFVHKPRFNAGFHKETRRLEPVWAELQGRAVAVLSGEDHNYQRFEPDRGVVQFVVGTGGRRRYDVDERDGRLAASRDDTFGALRLRVERGRVVYAFVGLDGEELDDGELRCGEG